MAIHDPGRIGLRRGIRAAIALPIALAITIYVLQDDTGGLFAAFGTAGLLITADFAGSALRRLVSYLLAGVAGAVLLVIGWSASASIAAAVLTTLVVAFGLTFASMLRGMLAVGVPAVILIFMVAVSIGGSASEVPGYLFGWGTAVVVSTIAALIVFPHDVRHDIRDALSTALSAAADACEAGWGDEATPESYARGLNALHESIDHLNSTYDGKPFRPTGASQRDRALTLAVSTANNLALVMSTAEPGPRTLPSLDGRIDLARASVTTLHDVSAAIADGTTVPSGRALDVARTVHQQATEAWVLRSSADGTRAERVAEVVQEDHVLRMAAVLIEQLAALARQINGAEAEQLDNEPPIPARPWSTVVKAHLSLESPWFRNSARTAVGLALAVLVVQLTGVGHGFWVLLGVLSVLRYDIEGTRRMAWLAILGTILGVVVITVVLVIVGPHSLLLWALLPVTVFLAAWAPVALNYPLGQAAFSGFVLLVLGIVDWPPDLMAGLVRIENMAIGAGVALLVGVLLWPRGAVGALHREVAQGLRLSSAFMSLSMRSLVDVVPAGAIADARLMARAADQRGSETYDMAVMQRGALQDSREWSAMTNATHLLLAVGRIMSRFRADLPILTGAPAEADAVDESRQLSDQHWTSVADALESARTAHIDVDAAPHQAMPLPTTITDAAAAHAYVVTVWVVNWVEHLDHLVPVPAGQDT